MDVSAAQNSGQKDPFKSSICRVVEKMPSDSSSVFIDVRIVRWTSLPVYGSRDRWYPISESVKSRAEGQFSFVGPILGPDLVQERFLKWSFQRGMGPMTRGSRFGGCGKNGLILQGSIKDGYSSSMC